MRSRGLPGRLRTFAIIGVGALIGAFVPGTVRAVPGAQTYYVSPSGNDAANGWTKKTAWRTLSRAGQQQFHAGDRLLLEGGFVHAGSIALDPSHSAGHFEIGSYGGGRAIIDAGDHSGIVIKNLNDIKISSLLIRGNGGTTDNEDLLARKNGILIFSQVDAQPAENTRYSDFSIDRVEVYGFEGTGVEIYSFAGTALSKARVSNVVVHDNAREGISVGADDIWSRPNQDFYIGHSTAYHNHGTPGLWHHTGSGIVIGGVTRGMIEHCEQYENGDLSDPSWTGGPVGIWAWDSDQVTIQFCKSHHMRTGNWDGGGYDFDLITTNSVMQYNVSWENQGYGYMLYEGGWGWHSANSVRCNVSIGDAQGPPTGQGALVGAFGLVDESFDHNLVYVENGGSEARIFQLSAWFGDNLRFHDNIVFAGPSTSPFVLDPSCWGGHCSGTNLRMFGNTYRFVDEPLPFWWDETQYACIADWRTATGLDLDSQVIVSPFELPANLEQLKTQPLTKDMFEQLIPGCVNVPRGGRPDSD
jgi:hypothetical protein